jgi:hypothetical protein
MHMTSGITVNTHGMARDSQHTRHAVIVTLRRRAHLHTVHVTCTCVCVCVPMRQLLGSSVPKQQPCAAATRGKLSEGQLARRRCMACVRATCNAGVVLCCWKGDLIDAPQAGNTRNRASHQAGMHACSRPGKGASTGMCLHCIHACNSNWPATARLRAAASARTSQRCTLAQNNPSANVGVYVCVGVRSKRWVAAHAG